MTPLVGDHLGQVTWWPPPHFSIKGLQVSAMKYAESAQFTLSSLNRLFLGISLPWLLWTLLYQFSRFGDIEQELWLLKVALFDTLDFLLNEYFDELNTANFNILNKFFNWILSKKITNELISELNFVEKSEN